MLTLGTSLHETIKNLEKIRDSQIPPQNDVINQLKELYAKQIDLVDAAIVSSTAEYINAAESMSEAAKKTQKAIEDLAKLEKAINQVADAIAKIVLLLGASAL